MAGNKNIIPLCKTIDWKKLKVIIKETVAFINKKYSKLQKMWMKLLKKECNYVKIFLTLICHK